MFLWIGRLVLGGLLKIGVGEATAGAFVQGNLFRGLVLLAIGALAVPTGKLIIAAHDGRVAGVERRVCVADQQLAASRVRASMLERTLKRALKTIAERDSDMARNREDLAKLQAELKEARDASISDDRSIVVKPGDPWLRPGRK